MVVGGSSVAPHTSLLMPSTDSTIPVVHFHVLTALEKPAPKTDLAIYIYAWCLRILQECSFGVNLEIGFQSLCSLEWLLQTQS